MNEAVIEAALAEIRAHYQARPVVRTPQDAARHFAVLLGPKEHEVFACLWLDTQHRVLKCEEMFRGTITETHIYPREVVKAALATNAAAVIFAHNHPSGVADPSPADERITRTLKEALALVEVRVLDHLVVGGDQVVSLAEKGLI